ncbi:hypothetical protein [Streptomyces sp. NPDC088254]|uniref:hypothetical protein n=1 Tax=Streptomyces sp. NPDC088254 TaxID=3365847 RepID=UPI0037F9BE3C
MVIRDQAAVHAVPAAEIRTARAADLNSVRELSNCAEACCDVPSPWRSSPRLAADWPAHRRLAGSPPTGRLTATNALPPARR